MVPDTHHTHLFRELPRWRAFLTVQHLLALRPPEPLAANSGNSDGRSCQNGNILYSWPSSPDRQPERHPVLPALQLKGENHCQTTVGQQCTSEKGTQNFRQLNLVFLLTYAMDPTCFALELIGGSPTSMTPSALYSSVFLSQTINQYFFKNMRIEPSFEEFLCQPSLGICVCCFLQLDMWWRRQHQQAAGPSLSPRASLIFSKGACAVPCIGDICSQVLH